MAGIYKRTKKHRELMSRLKSEGYKRPKVFCEDCKTPIKFSSKRCKSCQNKKVRYIGELHGRWKGDEVGYDALHKWVERNKQKPEFCEECNKNHPEELANISQMYKRDIKDFEWLCKSCHAKKHNRVKNFKGIPRGKAKNKSRRNGDENNRRKKKR